MKRLFFFLLSFLFLLSLLTVNAQTAFSVQDYQNFLNTHSNMKTEDLTNLHAAGYFKNKICFPINVKYLDSVSIKYGLTDYEQSLLREHGFVVTERLSQPSFFASFVDVFHKDLPVFITTDAILHALHASYDNILKKVEICSLIPRLKKLLYKLKNNEGNLRTKYGSDSLMLVSLKDVDLYISVALKLLGEDVSPYYQENQKMFADIISYVANEKVVNLKLFSENSRKIDFSQFKVRGHYDDEIFPILKNYFQSMIWLGRIEFYLIAPKGTKGETTFTDVQRQIIDSYLLEELFEDESAQQIYEQIEKTIRAFVGDQDNVTVDNLKEMRDSLGITDAFYFTDSMNVVKFKSNLATQPFAKQKILSHILMKNPFSPDTIEPASAFLTFGQRFVIDSYITGNVVFDKIKYLGSTIFRALPSTLDILFSLGNNASAQLLKDELERYHYASNLAALRYLVDSYDTDFWKHSIYNSWLNSIRMLNPLSNRENLPAFMQTAAWNQEKINTQLASWAELRHDNLLYAKQSYTGGVICSFPYGYVEPIPEFYQSVSELGNLANERLSEIGLQDLGIESILDYFSNLSNIANKLKTIAEKELNGTAFSQDEIDFLESVITKNNSGMCGAPQFDGWYTSLYYNYAMNEETFFNKNYVVADYHTAPTDAMGAMIGWVAHAGTGPVNLAIVVGKLPSGENVAFAGPVMSYYEYTTTNFLRINDAEWDSLYIAKSTRPDWVNIYLADKKGNSRGGGRSLLTKVENTKKKFQPVDYIVAENYPNPFGCASASGKSYTTIVFNVPVIFSGRNFSVKVYDITGREVSELLNRNLTTGNYLVRWYGKNSKGMNVASGVYIYRISIGSYAVEGKMNLIK